MTGALPPAVSAFLELFGGRTVELDRHLAENVELRPPTYGKSWFGEPLVQQLLSFAAQEFGGLSYTDIWRNGGSYVLRFEGSLDGQPLSGVDIVQLDPQGRIGLIEIFARPPGQMLKFRDRMGLRIQQTPSLADAMGLARS